VQFEVYTQARTEGRPGSKRARCLHCDGDWAYNETRLKTHIIDSMRGCQQVPDEVRERVRVESGDFRAGESPAAATHGRNREGNKRDKMSAGSPARSVTGKDGKEAGMAQGSVREGSGGIEASSSLKDTGAGVGPSCLAAKQKPERSAHIGIEFSRESGMQSRALWIAMELLQGQFSTGISRLSLIPVSSEHAFCLRIDDKPVWTRVPGQPALDYEAIRPILTAYFSTR
jgi:predicted Rdx family selenoprotein